MKPVSLITKLIITLSLVNISLVSQSYSAAIVPASVPLFQSKSVKPNIMLLFDTSGSMDTKDVGSLFYDSSYLALTNPSASNWEYCKSVDGSGNCKTWAAFPATDLKDANGIPLLNDGAMQRAKCGSSDQSKWVRMRKSPATSSSPTYCFRLDAVADIVSWKYSGLYLRWLFDKYGVSGGSRDLRSSTGINDPQTRLEVAKEAVIDILNLEGARFGLATFNNQSGSKIVRNCNDTTAHINDLKTTVTNLDADSWTPLAEAYYEVTRFFRGLPPNYSTSVHHSSAYCSSGACSGKFISPVQYECQKNIIITITDGYPTYDTSFPNNDPADVADTSRSLPNWDNERTNDIKFGSSCTDPDSISFKSKSDGLGYQLNNTTGCNTSQDDETHALFLDDLTQFAFDIDIKNDTELDIDGKPYAGKQNILSYTVGLNLDNQMLSDAGKNGGGKYYYANDSAQLKFSLRNALRDVMAKVGSSSAVTTNSTRLDTDTFIFQAQFKGAEWSGELRAFKIEEDGSIQPDPTWSTSTSENIFDNYSIRKIFTRNNSGTAIEFTWDNLDNEQKATLNDDPNTTALDDDGLGQSRLNWLRGDIALDGTTSGTFTFRARGKTGSNNTGNTILLGDIINSDPYFVGAANDYGYSDLPKKMDLDGDTNQIPEFITGSETYDAFVKNNLLLDSGQTPTFVNALYTAANDGMLHAFNAKTGEELFSYIPSSVFSRLPLLTSSDYQHIYLNDGSPWVGHAYIGSNEANRSWKTILIGSLGIGGKALYALDVSEPTNFSASNVMWEFTSSDLGYTINNPVMLPLANGKWGVIVANGIDSASNQAKLLILDATSGDMIATLNTNTGSSTDPNGLTSAIAVRSEDGIIRTVYGGDLHGNLWRFDISNKNAANWGVSYNNKPVFTAKDSLGNRQIITAELDVAKSVAGGYLIAFGTGKYIENSDTIVSENPQINTFYGIRDTGDGLKSNTAWTTITRSNLIQQTMTEQTINGKKFRNVSQNTVSINDKGWYLDLKPASGSGIGERVVEAPLLRNDRVIFVTLIPSQQTCVPGGTGWLMEVNAQTGSQLLYPVLDTNGDSTVNFNDIKVGGVAEEGILSTPAVITKGDELKFSSSSDGSIKKFTEARDQSAGRQSWRQLR